MLVYARYCITLIVCGFLIVTSVQAEERQVLIDGPDVDLTVGDMKRAILSMDPEGRAALLRDPGAIRRLMDSTYLTLVAAHRARQKGLDKKPEVAARIWNHEQNVLAVAELDDYLDKTGVDIDAAAKEYYLLHKADFMAPETRTMSHILIKSGKEGADQAKEQITRIRKLIESGEISFEDAARKYSQDASASRGGLLGTFGRGAMVKPFDDAVFSMKAGELSEPVKTRFGYHLIRVEKVIPPHQRDYDEVKGQIAAKLKTQKERKLREEYFLKIQDDPAAKADQQAIEAFVAHPGVK